MFLVVSFFGYDNCDGLADSLLGRIAEDALRAPIPGRNDAIEALAYNCIVTGFDDSGKRMQTLFAFFKITQECSDFRHVAINFKHGVIAKQLHSAVYNDFAAVLADMAKFARPIALAPKQRAQLGKFDWVFGL